MDEKQLLILARRLWMEQHELDTSLHYHVGTTGYRRSQEMEEARIALNIDEPIDGYVHKE